MSVFRCYSEKKPGFDVEARGLCGQLREQLGIDALEGVRILNRYDADRIAPEVYEAAKTVVFSEPQVDDVYDETFPVPEAPHSVLAVEALPGQFDQRADSCAQCIQLQSGVDRPLIAAAKVYLLMGTLTEGDLDKIRHYLINPVESREASMDKPATLEQEHEAPDSVAVVEGFTGLDEAGLKDLLDSLGLAMDLDDLKFLQAYFRDQEKRDPTITEVRVVDTYWSDHCRHTTFSTHLDDIQIDDPEVKAAYEQYLAARVEVYGEEKAKKRPQTLMDLATIGAKTLKKRGQLPELDESEEINACSIHVPAQVDGQEQDWLLMFKNETHNHPTEIEPFGGAATCIGGCIRDPLSGRVFVHQAMRVTGGGDPRVPLAQTTPGKLPQRKLATTAAAGYSSYGNQIGLATGHVAEVYHPGYIAKRLECGAVVGAAPAENVRRERPAPGHPQGRVDKDAAERGVGDAAADTGGRAAEGLNLGGVVVGLVFKHQQPVLLFSVHLGGDVDGAGVDLLALVQLGELAPLLQGLGPDGGQVHEGLGPLGGLLRSIDLHPGGQILLIGRLDVQVVDVDAVQVGGEGGVAAVVGPVGVHHPHLGDGGVPLLLVPEVGLEELQVVQIHGQPQGVQQVLEPRLIQAGKSLHHGHRVGGLVLLLQGGGLVHGGLPALHRVNEVPADLVQIALAQRPHQQVHLGGGDEGAVHPRLELDALGTGVGPLVVLPGQGLHRQDAVGGLRDREGLVVHVVHLWLGEDHRLGGLVHLRSDAVGVIPVQDAHPLQGVNPQLLPQLAAQAPGLHVEAGLFFRITAKYTHFFSSLPPGPARAVVSIVLPGIYS